MQVAIADPSSDFVPQPAMSVAPSLNATVPMAGPTPGAVVLTTAVKVTVVLNTAGFTSFVSAVAVAAGLTACVTGADELGV